MIRQNMGRVKQFVLNELKHTFKLFMVMELYCFNAYIYSIKNKR